MSETRGPKPGGKPFEVDRAKPKPRALPRELPRAPEREETPWTITQIAGAAILVVFGLCLIGFFALDLPLSAIGGPSVLIVPLVALALVFRRRIRR